MVANITDWTNSKPPSVAPWHEGLNSANLNLDDVKDTVQTDPTAFPKRIGDWKTVLLSHPFTINDEHFIALAVTESNEICGRYTGCTTSYKDLVVMTKYNSFTSKFEQHQRLVHDASPVAIEHLSRRIDKVKTAHYLVVANDKVLKGAGVNIYYWNQTTQLFVLRQTLTTDLPHSDRRILVTPRSLKYFYVPDPGIHFLAVAYYSEQDPQGYEILKTQSFVYSWVPEGRTVLADGSVDAGVGFQVFQLLRTNGATSFNHLEIPCDCQGMHAPPTVAHSAQETCISSMHMLTVSNEVDSSRANDDAASAGATIWRFRARHSNSDSSMWRLHGKVGVFELLQSLPSVPTISSTAFHIQQQGCFFAYLVRNSFLTLAPDAEWMARGETGGAIHLYKYQGGSTPTQCLHFSTGNACAFDRIQIIGQPEAESNKDYNNNNTDTLSSKRHTAGRSAPHQMSRGPFSCSTQGLGCLVGAHSIQHVQSEDEHYIFIAQSVCERGEATDECNAKTAHGVLETRSAVLQWDKGTQQMDELLSISDATSINLRGEPITIPEERRLQSYPFRIPGGRASAFASTEMRVGEGASRRHNRTVVILSSLTAGAIMYDWELPVLSGLNGSSSVLSAKSGAIYHTQNASFNTTLHRRDTLANWHSLPEVSLKNVAPNASEYVYVLSNIDRTLATFEKRKVFDIFGNLRSWLAYKTIITMSHSPTPSSTTKLRNQTNTSGLTNTSSLDLRGAASLRFFMVPYLQSNMQVGFRPTIAAKTRAPPGESLCGQFAAGSCQSIAMTVQHISGASNLLMSLPIVTANGTVILQPAFDRVGTATYGVRARDSGESLVTPGPGVSAEHIFRVTVIPVNDKPSFDTRDVVAQQCAGEQTFVFAVNATPGATRRSSQLVSFAENSSGLVFELVQTVTHTRTSSTTSDDTGSLWEDGHAPSARFVYSSDVMFGTVTFTAKPRVIGFAEFQAVLIDSEGSSDMTGAEDRSDIKTFRITIRHVNQQPTFAPFNQDNIYAYSPPSSIGSVDGVTRSVAEKRLAVVDFVSSCQEKGTDARFWVNTSTIRGLEDDRQQNSVCAWDERQQRFLFHVMAIHSLDGNFGGTDQDLSRNGGDLFEPHRAEILCDLSLLDAKRKSVVLALSNDCWNRYGGLCLCLRLRLRLRLCLSVSVSLSVSISVSASVSALRVCLRARLFM